MGTRSLGLALACIVAVLSSLDLRAQNVRRLFYARLDAVLSRQDPDFAHLSTTDRVAIREILEATKPEFAARQLAGR